MKLKDSWDADDDEKKDEEKTDEAAPVKPKKTRQQKIAEKEVSCHISQRFIRFTIQIVLFFKKLDEERENKRRKEREEEEMANMTPEQRAAEILRRKQLEMEADTKLGLVSAFISSQNKAGIQ